MMKWRFALLLVLLCASAPAQNQLKKEKKQRQPAPNHADTAATGAFVPIPEQPPIYTIDFISTEYGRTPAGWLDLTNQRPARNWGVDGNGFVRVMLKRFTGILAYDGAVAGGTDSSALVDCVATAQFKKTEETEVRFGMVARLHDTGNHYLARFSGNSLLELFKVKDGRPALLMTLPTLERYREGEVWTMKLATMGDLIAVAVLDPSGRAMARVDARDGEFKTGRVGLSCTTFASSRSFRIDAIEKIDVTRTPEQITAANRAPDDPMNGYPVVRPFKDVDAANTRFAAIKDNYDVIVAGGGTGGTAAAVQAARLGAKVLLLEETDWIGGQMACAAVPTMDEGGCYRKFPVRERGFYREFHESMVTYYYTLDKDPFNAYFSGPTLDYQLEGGYEPKVTRAVLYGLIDDVRQRKQTLDLSVRSRITKVKKTGDVLTGATVEIIDDIGTHTKEIASKVIIDATEYGDVIPLTGARYRVGTVTSDKIDPRAAVQDHTWVGVFREYPKGIPEHLKIKSPPPNYAEYGKKWANYDPWGPYETVNGNRNWRVYFAWRGMADTEGPLTGLRSEKRHTQCGFNGGNDYPVTVATLEDREQRRKDEREGIYRTLSALYYFQNELGLNWSLAEDEGYNTPFNRAQMKDLQLRPDLEKLAIYLPQQPYVRESRRIIGVKTMVAADLDRYKNEVHMETSIAMGDYFMDLHRTEESLEHDLDKPGYCGTDGPFQVKFEAFIPERIDGFLPAEKNLSQSRLVSGATRMQPSTMLTGQAAGTIAALAVKHGVQPRKLDVRQVQTVQLDNGSTLIQRWYADVPWGTPLWRATQMLSLYGVLDRPGPISPDHEPLATQSRFGAGNPMRAQDREAALKRLLELKPASADEIRAIASDLNAGDFALAAGKILLVN